MHSKSPGLCDILFFGIKPCLSLYSLFVDHIVIQQLGVSIKEVAVYCTSFTNKAV